ncbi:hypothetical protein D3C72_2581580 [compost metagenome]
MPATLIGPWLVSTVTVPAVAPKTGRTSVWSSEPLVVPSVVVQFVPFAVQVPEPPAIVPSAMVLAPSQ